MNFELSKKEIPHKIIIIGDSCRGKSTLASKISLKLNIPFYSTDDFLYEVKFTKYRDKKQGFDMIEKIYKKENWIVEGTTGYLLKPGLDSADIIVNLVHRSVIIQWLHLVKRYFKRDHENESLKKLFGLMKHVLYKRNGWGYRREKIKISDLIEPYKNKVITISSFKDIDKFVNSLTTQNSINL